MKQVILVVFCLISVEALLGQTIVKEEAICASIGILQGGGSLIGADLEVLVAPHFGLQIGAGIIGYGAAALFHTGRGIRSSAVALTYWNQGIMESFAQNAIGVSYIFRGKRWLTAQLGLARPLSQGPAFPSNTEQPPVMLLYSVGVYIAH